MNQIRNFLHRFAPDTSPLPAGIHHFQTPPDAPQQYRLHLRLEPDGTGVLIVNASTILQLNRTAAEYAYYLVKGYATDDVVKTVTTRYHVDPAQVSSDYQNIQDRIETLVLMPDLDPVSFLDFERVQPNTAHLSAPLRLDCALTYRTLSGMDPRIAPTGNVRRELSTQEWQTVLSKAWGAGIPHIIFTGGEPTTRADVPDLVRYAESLGQVTGLITDGLRLSDTRYLHNLLQSGLDHLMIVLLPEEDEVWAAMRNVIPEDLSLTVHLTVTPQNAESFISLIDRVHQLGVTSMSLSANDHSLVPHIQTAREYLATNGISVVWNLPVPYSALHPVTLEVSETTPEEAGRTSLYLEPDGDVLPAQGVNHVLGNLLEQPWESIWKPQ